MKTILAAILFFVLAVSAGAQTNTQVDPDEAAAIAASDKIFSRLYTAEAQVKTQAAEIAALKQQLAAAQAQIQQAQAATAAAIAERDAARRAVADAKAQITALAAKL